MKNGEEIKTYQKDQLYYVAEVQTYSRVNLYYSREYKQFLILWRPLRENEFFIGFPVSIDELRKYIKNEMRISEMSHANKMLRYTYDSDRELLYVSPETEYNIESRTFKAIDEFDEEFGDDSVYIKIVTDRAEKRTL